MEQGAGEGPPEQPPAPVPPPETIQEMKARKKREMKVDPMHYTEEFPILDPYLNVSTANTSTRAITGIIVDCLTAPHFCEWDAHYPENVGRIQCIVDRCLKLNLFEKCLKMDSPMRSDLFQRMLRKHTGEHYHLLRTICGKTVSEREEAASNFDAVYFSKKTLEIARRALSAAINLVRAVANREIQNGMAIIRPPGHHAMESDFCGYCFFNNVAIATESILDDKMAQRVLILDFDVHHGQGTQQMFYRRKDVLYFSIHRYEHGTFWPNLPESNFNFIGEGAGLGYNVNVPLNEIGLTDADYLAIVFHLLLPMGYEFDPDVIIVSAGYDSCVGDEKGRMKVTPAFYGHLMMLIAGMARGRVAVCLEGGYFAPSLAEGVAMTLKGLIGEPCAPLEAIRSIHPSVMETITNVKRVHHDYWKCFGKVYDIDTSTSADNVFKIEYHGDEYDAPFDTRNCYPYHSQEDYKRFQSIIEILKESYDQTPSLRTVHYVYDQDMMLHTPKYDYFERPENHNRISAVGKIFREYGIQNRMKHEKIISRDFSEYNVQDECYLQSVDNLVFNTKDLYSNDYTYFVCQLAVSSLLTLLDVILTNGGTSGVGVVRPPGHHAEYQRAMGFCFFNNAAIAANYALKRYFMQRILIIDFDIHHGNGTQNAFYESKEVMYISVHRYDQGKFYPVGSPANYTYDGYGVGRGYNINIPFNGDKMGDSEYLAVFHTIILPIAYSFCPDLVIISAGFDAGVNDPLGGYMVQPETFGHFVQVLKPLAKGKILLVMEGGYNLHTLGYGMGICGKALLGDPLPRISNVNDVFSPSAKKTIRQVAEHFQQYWPILGLHRLLPKDPIYCEKVGLWTESKHDLGLMIPVDAGDIFDVSFVRKRAEQLRID